MSTHDPHQPAPQPQYMPQPQYAPHPGSAQQQFQQPPQPLPQLRPSAPLNKHGLAALIIVAVVSVIGEFCIPFVMRAINELAMQYSQIAYLFWNWIPFLMTVPLLIVALLLAVVGMQRKRPNRGKALAYVALGGAGFAIAMNVIAMMASRLAYAF